MTDTLAGLVIGFLGSFHCIGMCGPITLMLPEAGNSIAERVISRTVYNLGRIVTYTVLGFLFGLLGSRLILSGFQHTLSIVIGVAIIIYLILPRSIKASAANTPLVVLFNKALRKGLSTIAEKKGIPALFSMGIINGLLPCGFVYLGLSGAINLPSAGEAALFMAFFGLGTFPAMLITSIAGQRINLQLRKKISKILPYLAALMALLLILRGLNLGIPFVSPKIDSVHKTEIVCGN